MPHPIPICSSLKGEETVMMIIRLGNIFPLSHFRLISQIPSIKKAHAFVRALVCVLLMKFEVFPRKQGLIAQVCVVCSWHRLTCHGRFIIVHIFPPSFPSSHTFLVILKHLELTHLLFSFHFQT